ncbi:MAG: hypothetical protein ACLRYB_18325 [Segatella copri]
MAKKTVIKKALKYAPLKTDFVKAVGEDEATFDIKSDGDEFDIIQKDTFDEENIVEIRDEDIEIKEDVNEEPKQAEIDTQTGEIKK